MSFELYYTSAPRGLRRSSSGFCTVAATDGMPVLLMNRLEQLSSYQPLFDLASPDASKNPVAYAHWRIMSNGRSSSVLSRVCSAGFDHTGRPSKFAYHLVLDINEQPEGGPAWTMRQPGAMEEQWEGDPRLIPSGKVLLGDDSPPRPCLAWEAATGDAGWGGILADAFLQDPAKPAYLICDPTFDPLPLLDESIALIPARMRWQVTFSTFFTGTPAGLNCAWRCVRTGTATAREALRHSGAALVIDLTRAVGPLAESRAVRIARDGEMFNRA